MMHVRPDSKMHYLASYFVKKTEAVSKLPHTSTAPWTTIICVNMCCLLACYLRWAVLCPCVCFCIRSHPFSSIICSRNCFSFCPSTLIFSFTGLFQSAKRQAIISTMLKKKIDPLFTTCFPIFLVSFCSIIPWKSCLYLLLRFLLPYSVKPIPIRPLHHSELRQFLSFSSNFHVARCHMLLSLFILLDLSATFDRAISLNLETLSSLLCRITHTPGYLLPQCWLLVILLCLSLHRLSIGEPQSSGLVFCVSHNSLH